MPLVDEHAVAGCRYLDADSQPCGAPRRPHSSYCERHHAICHVTLVSARGRARLREIERLGGLVGGRSTGSPGVAGPSAGFLRRLEKRRAT